MVDCISTQPPTFAAERFFTIQETADILKMSRSGLYRLIKLGVIKTIQLGRLRRVPASEISRLSKSNR